MDNYNKNNEKDEYVEMGNYKCLQNFGRESLKDDKTLRSRVVFEINIKMDFKERGLEWTDWITYEGWNFNPYPAKVENMVSF